MNNFSPLLNSSCEVMTRVTTQLPSGQVSESWTVAISDVKCRKDMAPRAYSVKDDKYKSLEERYIFFVDSAYKTQITRSNRIQHEGVDYFIVDITNFDGFANLHHIEIYCIKVDLGGGAGMDFEAGATYLSGQAITIDSITKQIDWGGIFDADISVISTNDNKIDWNSSQDNALSAFFNFSTASQGDIQLGQIDPNNNGAYTKMIISGADVFEANSGFETQNYNGELNNFKVFGDRIQSLKYPQSRDDSIYFTPDRFVFTDDQGNFFLSNFAPIFDNTYETMSALNGYFTNTFATLFQSQATNTENIVLNNTETGATQRSMMALTQTWNTSGRMTAIKFNLTDTQSDPTSKFFDFLKGGVSQMYLSKNGDVVIRGNFTGAINYANDGTVGAPAYSFGANTAMGMWKNGTTLSFSNSSGTLGLSLDANNKLLLAGRLNAIKGANVASAGDLTLGNGGNVFSITGTTTINTIIATNWSAGAEIKLIFGGASVVTHNAGTGSGAKIFLAGSTNYTPANNSVLTLVYDGTQWQEVCRKTP